VKFDARNQKTPLGRTSSHRLAMLRAMVTFLLENGKIETTVTRAKEVRAMTEKMITTAKNNEPPLQASDLLFCDKRGRCEETV
jgi:large subunit ribosomal protein L17